MYLIKDVIKDGREKLENAGIDPREARLLLAFALNIELDELITHDTCTDGDIFRFEDAIKRRIAGEPYAYIVGTKEFMKLKFIVNKNVLIPREDTEILVLEAIKQCKRKVLDMCTGSGCIAVSLAKYLNPVSVDAVDISSRALNVAKKNAELNEVNVNFIWSNLFDKVLDKYEMIVSNPPYIRTSDMKMLQDEVKKEPKRALDGGESGLIFYEQILKDARDYLTDDGVILLEIGYEQAEDVARLMKENNYKKIRKIKDLSGNDRVMIAERG